MIGKEFALQLPDGAVAMNAEEMMYVEGGATPGTNQYYREQRQRILKLQMSRLSEAQKRAIYQKCIRSLGNYLSVVLGSVAAVATGGTSIAVGAAFSLSWGGYVFSFY